MNQRNLPSWDFAFARGWSTNYNPRSVSAIGLQVATNIHHYEEFRSIGKTFGTAAVSPDLGGTVQSLHYAELNTPDQVRQRIIVAVANGALRTYESSTSWGTPSLPTGATLTSEAMGGAIMYDRLHLSSENQTELPTGGLKYDGVRVTNWGVQAPGTLETVVEQLDDNTNWTAGSEATKADDSRTLKSTTGSVKVTKTGTGATQCRITRGSLSHDVSGAGQGAGYIYLYISPGTLQLLEQTAGLTTQFAAPISISVTNAAGVFTNSAFYNWDVGDLLPGWNLLTWTWDSPTGTTGSGWTSASTIGAIDLCVTAKTAGTTISGDQFVLWDWLYIVDEGAPTLADAASGSGPSGTYTGVVTFITEYGLESNAGPASASLTLTDNTITWSAIPVSTDDQVIARRLYRDISGDGIYRFVAQIDDNETTTYSDSVADVDLDDTTQPPFAGDSIFDNSPPGRLIGAKRVGERIMGIDAANKRVIAISDYGSPEGFRLVDRLVLEQEITAIEVYEPGVLFYSTDSVYYMQGDGVSGSFQVAPFGAHTMGANGFRSVTRMKGGGHVAVQEEKVSLILQPEDNWLLNGPILDQWQALTSTDLANFHVVFDPKYTRIFFFDSASNDVFVYQFGVGSNSEVSGDGPGIDPQDVRRGIWYKYELPSAFAIKDSALVETTAESPEIWFCSGNYVYGFDDTVSVWANGASTESISMTLETQWVPLNQFADSQPGVGRGEPRFLRIHQFAAGAVTYTVTVTMARDPDVDNTSPITVSWSQTVTGNESLVVPIPTQGAGRGEWAKVKLVSTTNDTPVIAGLEMFYIPRGLDFSGPRT